MKTLISQSKSDYLTVNKILFSLIVLSIILWVTSLVIEIPYADPYILLAILQDLAVLMMLLNGTFINTKLFTGAKFAIGVMILGAIFKIMHLNGGDEIIVLSNLGLLATYLVHFLRKPSKKVLDILKLLMVIMLVSWRPLRMLHMISEETTENLQLVAITVTLITFATFVHSLIRERKLLGGSEDVI